MQIKVNPSGIIIAFVIVTLVASALTALMGQLDSHLELRSFFDGYFWHITWFSFYQALLSTLLSVSLAIPVAYALYRRHFFGKKLLLKLFGSTLVLPVLVAVFGLLAIYGNKGLIAELTRPLSPWLGQYQWPIFGLMGILLAHVFLNLPYSARLLCFALDNIPNNQHLLCVQLGMSPWQKFYRVEWPAMRGQVIQCAGLVFMLCFTSFAVVMILGGGPQSTTIELAIYSAIKFDFDLSYGALLALWQLILCSGFIVAIHKLSPTLATSIGDKKKIWLICKDGFFYRLWDYFWVALVVLLVVPPLISVINSGLSLKGIELFHDAVFWQALTTSLSIASLSSLLTLLCGFLLLTTASQWRFNGENHKAERLERIGSLILMTSGIVLATGAFILLQSFTDAFEFGFVIVVVINALMALPYVIKTLSMPMYMLTKRYQCLCLHLGLRGFRRFIWLEWRALMAPIVQVLVIAFMLSLGDLTVIALFGSQDFQTLPLLLNQLLASYQMQAAGFVAMLLLLLSLSGFFLVEYIAQKTQATRIHQ